MGKNIQKHNSKIIKTLLYIGICFSLTQFLCIYFANPTFVLSILKNNHCCPCKQLKNVIQTLLYKTLFLVSAECVGHNLPEAREDEDDDLNDGEHRGPQVETQVTSNHSQEIIQSLQKLEMII